MAVTGQDLPGLRKQTASARRRNAALAQFWGAVKVEAGRAVSAIQRLLALTGDAVTLCPTSGISSLHEED